MAATLLHTDTVDAPVRTGPCSPKPQPQLAHRPLRRVTYVVSLFPSWSETFIVREIRSLIDDGVDVRIVSLKRPRDMLLQTDSAALMDRVHMPGGLRSGVGGVVQALVSHPATVLGAAATIMSGMWREPVAMLKSLGALARGLEHLPWLRSFDPEFIHAHWATYPSTVAWALGRILDRPFGFTAHAHDIFANNQLLSHKLRDSALAVTISRYNVDWFDRHVSATAHEKLQVVHCGVDLAHIEWRPSGRTDNLILAVGRLHPIKGFETLIEALALARNRGRDFSCAIVGDGPLRAKLQALVNSLGLQKHVKLLGAQPQETVRALLQQSAIFALPSQVAADGGRDGIPVALMEAMASGPAVVSCQTSGIPELIEDGEHGLLVAERDPAALAGALQTLLGDAGLRHRLAAAARRRIEHEFDARQEARRLHTLMSTAVANVT